MRFGPALLRLLLVPFCLCLTAIAPAEADPPGWYPWTAKGDPSPGEIGLADWLPRPAGKDGRIERRGAELLQAGRPIKLWGLNLCYSACAPEKALAEKRARFYAKYGINAVRLHKYADGTGWAGIQSRESFVDFDPAALDRMDYQVARLRENGIYVKLSSTFGVKLGPADRKRVPYMDEFGGLKGDRVATGHGSIYLARELQDLQIAQIVKILGHRNPYTGLTYAEDPAIAVVELFNEDSALWFGVLQRLQKVPTLRRRASERFGDWLETRYGSHDGLVKAWGPAAIDSFRNEGFTGERLEKRTIAPAGNPWFYDPVQLAGSQAPKRKRLLDTMLFLYEVQNEFHDRYVAAIREAGYRGEVLGSNWQAGRAMSHYYNLHSDARVGLIDRHNYFGGGEKGKFAARSMLSLAGSGLLGSGVQQVADRPFMLSEWNHVYPNEWGAEGPAILGAYGMGLQGWDASFVFQNRDSGGFSDRIGREPWDATAPQVLGVFPAVARQVLRGDVREAGVVATRRVHLPSLREGKVGFEDGVAHEGDVKSFGGEEVPARTLAVARNVVEFTDSWRDTPAFDLEPFEEDGSLVSSTGELRWKEGASKVDGHFTVSTAATKAVVGFAGGRTFDLGGVTIEPRCRFAAIYVTAQGRGETIESARKLLVVAIARARNSGMRLGDAEDAVLERGGPPVLMEPVKATIALGRPGASPGGRPGAGPGGRPDVPTVILLDHDGLPTGRTIPVRDGTFEIDGERDRTPYYLVRYDEPDRSSEGAP